MPTVRKIIFRVVLPAMLTLLVLIGYTSSRRPRGCGFDRDKFTIGTVNYGPFVEYIPQTGHIEVDSITKHPHVWVDIDELYFPRISTGLNATTTFNNRDYKLKIDEINPVVANGRFRVRLEFNSGDSIKVQNLSLRLRIQLADTSMQILLPVGGFYKDTGGNWVYVM
ncbi:MAG: hypothetical protein QM762_12150 [Chryseolinea sp.]